MVESAIVQSFRLSQAVVVSSMDFPHTLLLCWFVAGHHETLEAHPWSTKTMQNKQSNSRGNNLMFDDMVFECVNSFFFVGLVVVGDLLVPTISDFFRIRILNISFGLFDQMCVWMVSPKILPKKPSQQV